MGGCLCLGLGLGVVGWDEGGGLRGVEGQFWRVVLWLLDRETGDLVWEGLVSLMLCNDLGVFGGFLCISGCGL